MSRTLPLASLSTMVGVRSAVVVISPATTTRSVVTSVSQATRLVGSAARPKSRTASLIWSATLSGWPMETDSLVNKYRSVLTKLFLIAKGNRCQHWPAPLQGIIGLEWLGVQLQPTSGNAEQQ